MTQQQIRYVGRRKIHKCIYCGGLFSFKSKTVKLNLDGTVHVCKATDEQRKKKPYSEERLKFLKWFFGYGPGYKYRHYDYYNNEERRERREEAYRQRNKFREQYYNPGLGREQACDILGIEHDIMLQICRTNRWDLPEKVKQIIKNAYRKQALRYHPDRCKDQDAATKFIKATEAYEKILGAYA